MKTPIFVRGTFEKVKSAVENGVIVYPAYIFLTDTNEFAFLDSGNIIKKIVGHNVQHVVKVDSLSTEGALEDVLYILGNTVYIYNKSTDEFIPTYRDMSDEVFNVKLEVLKLSEEFISFQDTLNSFYNKDEIDEMLGDLSHLVDEQGEQINVIQYVSETKDDAIKESTEYTDTAIKEAIKVLEYNGETDEEVDNG